MIIDWIMEYFPIGVLALTTVEFASYGVTLLGPYAKIAACVITGILIMIFVVYPLLILIVCRENPCPVMIKLKGVAATAFLTRSSAAVLPVAMKNASEKLHIKKELSSFALPLGATVNMDGVCVHLPVFAVLAANIFGIELCFFQMIVLLFFVLASSIGAAGVPGASVLFLFMILSNLGLNDKNVTMIVTLAIGINPLLDMFETACNVTGDNVVNYIVARKTGMIEEPEK